MLTVPPRILVVMGVSGCGKSSVAMEVSQRLGWPFQEGDDLHPPANIAKMRAGTPLTDEDRWPWLALVAGWIGSQLDRGQPGVITCSALKRSYRQRIANGRPGVAFLYLHATRAVLEAHVTQRHHEFMPSSLLDSQLVTLEEPGDDEEAIRVDVTDRAETTAVAALAEMDRLGAAVR